MLGFFALLVSTNYFFVLCWVLCTLLFTFLILGDAASFQSKKNSLSYFLATNRIQLEGTAT